MKLSVCTDIVNYGKDFFEGVDSLLENGVKAVEFWKWSDKDLEKLKKYVDDKKMTIPGFCLDSSDEEISDLCLGNLMSGGMTDKFMIAINESVNVARELNAGFLIATVGDEVDGISYDSRIENIKRCINSALEVLEKNNIVLLLEPLCKKERPRYLVPGANDMLGIIKDINSKNVRLLYDVYHQFHTGDYSVEFILENSEYIGHIHIANPADRCEPEDGEINFTRLFAELKNSGYVGYVGLEYIQSKKEISEIISEYMKSFFGDEE